jgi:hypothetical protein
VGICGQDWAETVLKAKLRKSKTKIRNFCVYCCDKRKKSGDAREQKFFIDVYILSRLYNIVVVYFSHSLYMLFANFSLFLLYTVVLYTHI